MGKKTKNIFYGIRNLNKDISARLAKGTLDFVVRLEPFVFFFSKQGKQLYWMVMLFTLIFNQISISKIMKEKIKCELLFIFTIIKFLLGFKFYSMFGKKVLDCLFSTRGLATRATMPSKMRIWFLDKISMFGTCNNYKCFPINIFNFLVIIFITMLCIGLSYKLVYSFTLEIAKSFLFAFRTAFTQQMIEGRLSEASMLWTNNNYFMVAAFIIGYVCLNIPILSWNRMSDAFPDLEIKRVK